MNNKLMSTFEYYCEELKESIIRKWDKLTEEDFKEINGSYYKLVYKIGTLYGYKIKAIEDQLNELVDSEGFAEIGNSIQDLKNKIAKKANGLKQITKEDVKEYLSNFKDNSIEVERHLLRIARENPIKTLGLATLVGSTFAYFLSQYK